ncbi:MAG TPA: glycosyltransferase family 2 protein, partial [Thermoanaerobaculia bacterium]|nr:glycosyltransferase family 2 protein [Thermoanaerobaculia bacterium]
MSAAADVILISWNGLTDTVRALESLRSQTSALRAAGHDLQITVVDNGSSDNTERVIRSSFPKVRLLRLEENRGFTGGIAHAARSSEADALIFLNNDAVVEPGWLGEMLDILLTAPDDVIAASGRMVDPTGTLADFVRGVMTFDGHGFQPGFRQPLEKVDEPPDGSEILFPCGGNMIVKRKAFLDLGGFDEDYFAYLEDVDFGWRAWLSGWRVLYTSRAVVRHRSSATSERLGHFERGVLFEKNAMQTFLKNIDDDLLGSFSGPFFLT